MLHDASSNVNLGTKSYGAEEGGGRGIQIKIGILKQYTKYAHEHILKSIQNMGTKTLRQVNNPPHSLAAMWRHYISKLFLPNLSSYTQYRCAEA